MDNQFDLLSRPWIPVVTMEGATQSISLREALINAPAYRGVSASLPHTNAALLRLLLAVLHRNFGPADPDAWEAWWGRGSFDAAVLDAYFDRWHDRFDLFSSQHPFYQQRHPLAGKNPAQVLLQMIGGGDTFTLFDHVMDETPFALAPPEAALMLVTAQSFGLAGLCHPQHKLFYTDAPCSRAIVFFVEGKSLFETLMFNLVRYNPKEPFAWNKETGDRPTWEVDDPYFPERTRPLGYLDYLTWPNRKIMLFPEEQNGKTVVTQITTAPGLILAAEVRNPMHHYRIDAGKKAGEETLKMLRFSEGRSLWRDSSALLDVNNQAVDPPRALAWVSELVGEGILPHRRLQLAAYGMCTEPGRAKVHFYRSESFEFDDDLLRNDRLVAYLNTALSRAEDIRRELWGVITQLATLMIAFDSDLDNGRKPDVKDVQNLVQHWDTQGLYWGRLEAPFHRFLNELGVNPDAALQAWQAALRSAALSAYRQTAEGLGENLKALKAVAKTNGRLYYGINKVLSVQPEGGIHAKSSDR